MNEDRQSKRGTQGSNSTEEETSTINSSKDKLNRNRHVSDLHTAAAEATQNLGSMSSESRQEKSIQRTRYTPTLPTPRQ